MVVRLKRFFFITTLIIISSCDHGHYRKLIQSAEKTSGIYPLETLELIGRIDTLSLHSKQLKERIMLVRAIALDKIHENDGRLVNDMERASEWFSRFGSKRRRMLSEYYYGDQLQDAGLLEEATVWFMRAQSDAEALKDDHYAALAARRQSSIYKATFNYPEELSSIERAMGFFSIAGDEVHKDDARIKMAVACFDNSMFAKADSLFEEAIAIAAEKRDVLRLHEALARSAELMLYGDSPNAASAIERLSKAERLGYSPTCRDLGNYAYAHALIGNETESERYVSAAYDAVEGDADLAYILDLDYRIKMLEGDTKTALARLQESYSHMDSVTTKTLEQSIVKAQKIFLVSAIEHLERGKRHITIVSCLIVFLFAFSSIVTIAIFKKKQKYRKLEDMRRQITMEQYRIASEEIGRLGFESFERILEAYDMTGRANDRDVAEAFSRVVGQFRSDDDFRLRFLANVDNAHGMVITKLRKQVQGLPESQITLFGFLVQRLSYTTITVLMGKRSRQNIYDSRQRLVKAIKAQSPADMDLFLSFIPVRR